MSLIRSSALVARRLVATARSAAAPFSSSGASSSSSHQAVFMAGIPGAGKTRIIEKRFGLLRDTGGSQHEGTVILDLDREMRAHPAYDPAARHTVYNVEGAYEWADERVEERFQQALQTPLLTRIVIDGTGTKVARRTQRMMDARAAGHSVTLLYVKVSLETALLRNARRNRVVPSEVLTRYEAQLDASVVELRPFADVVEIYDNDGDDPRIHRMRHDH